MRIFIINKILLSVLKVSKGFLFARSIIKNEKRVCFMVAIRAFVGFFVVGKH